MTAAETVHGFEGPTPFEESAFYQSWEATLAPKFPIRGRLGPWCVTPKKLAKGLVHLKELRVPGWNGAWSDGVSPEHLDTLVSSAQTGGWDVARMTQWASPQLDRTLATLRHGGFQVAVLPEQSDYRMDLSGGWEGYLAQRGGHARRKILKRFREVAPLSPELRILDPQNDLDAFLDRLIPAHIAYWKDKPGGAYMEDPREQAFLRTWMHRLAKLNQIELDELVLEGQVANYSICLRHGGLKYALMTASTGVGEAHFPGVLGLYLRIERAAREGQPWFLVGPGTHPYKVQAATHAVPRQSLVVAHPKSLVGRGFVKLLQSQYTALSATP